MSMLWVVIYGKTAPQEEIDNAQKVAEKLRGEGKIVRVLDDSSPLLYPLHLITSVVSIGGPDANSWTAKLEDRINPTAEFVYDDEGGIIYQDSHYIKVKDGKVESFPVFDHGIIGVGTKIRPRLQIVVIEGYDLKDTTSLIGAYLNGEPAGVYSTPTRTSYTLVGC